MEEVSIAPQYKFTTFGSPPPQASAAESSSSPAAINHPTNTDTTSLQATITQLKEDNAKAELKQEELQNQIKTLQISVSSLTESYFLTTTSPKNSMQSTVKSLSELLIILQNVLTEIKYHPNLRTQPL